MNVHSTLRISVVLLACLAFLIPGGVEAQLIKTKFPIVFVDSVFNTLDSSVSKVRNDSVWIGLHPTATMCQDDPISNGISLGGFATHWSISDSGTITEYELPPVDPPSGENFFGIMNTPCNTSSRFKFNIHPSVSSVQRDTFRVTWKVNPDPGLFHRKELRWPTNMSSYYDSSKLVRSATIFFADVNAVSVYKYPSTDAFMAQTVQFILIGPKTPPQLDTLAAITPPNGSAITATSTTLSWAALTPAFYYRVQVSTSPTFATLLVNDSLSATSRALSGLSGNTTYYWRVLGMNARGATWFHEPPYNFRVEIRPPAVTLLSPANNSTAIPTSTTFRWTSVTGTSVSYRVQVDTSTAFTSPIIDDSLVTDTTKSITGLLNCYNYYWRVRAKNSNGIGPWPTAAFSRFRVALAAPGTPALLLPADAATGVSLTPTLTWRGDACSDNYRLVVSRDAAFTQVFINQVLNSPSSVLGALGQESVYYWQVRALNSVDSSGMTAIRSFRTLLNPAGVPSLLLPANNDTTVAIPTQFRWNKIATAATYQLQVSLAINFATMLFNDSTFTDTSTTLGSLLNCTRYYWRVKAKNASGSAGFTTTRNFKTIEAISAMPGLVSPANGAIGRPEVDTMKWSGDACVKRYAFELRDSATSTLRVRDTLVQTFRQVGPLSSATTYFWTVWALNGQGTSDSLRVKFTTTAATTPPVPVLQSPSNLAAGIGVTPTLSWDSSARATSYRLQVALDSAFTLLVFNDSTIPRSAAAQVSKQVGPLLNSRTYFWRANAKNAIGTSAYPTAFRFATLYPPNAPTLIQPVNGSTGESVAPTFVWTLAQRADVYRLQVAEDSLFVVIAFDDSTIVEQSWKINVSLKSKKRHYWRVWGKNAVGFGAPSATWAFETERIGSANHTIPIAVAETGPARDTVYFGISPFATRCIDPSLNEYEIPQAPFGWFDLRFLDHRIPSCLGEGVRVNYHPFSNYGQVDTFKIKWQVGTGTYPVTISWPTALVDIICDSMIIKDEFGGTLVRARMDQASSVVVTNTTIGSLIIISYGAFPIISDVHSPRDGDIPKGFTLSQNYPNPFNPSTRIEFTTERLSQVRVVVYDVLGREIATLANGSYPSGFYHLAWDGRDEAGRQMPSGIYYARMIATNVSSEGTGDTPFISVRKMMMMK